VSATSNPTPTVSVQLRRHRFSVESYDEMIAKGILTSDDRVELLAGEIIERSRIGPPHAACVRRLTQLLFFAFEDRLTIAVRNPIVLPPDSEPEPDIAILRPRDDFYFHAHPRPNDVLLLIEVADSSLTLDQLVKLPLYAAAGISEVWIVDLTANRIEVHTQPVLRTYSEKRMVSGTDVLTPTALPDLSLRVSDILPFGG